MNDGLAAWALRWGVPPAALKELAAMSVHDSTELSRPVQSEGALQALVRLEGVSKGVCLWRNNSGALPDKTGRIVRFGLGNDSPVINKVFKSSDLIGLRGVLIKPDDVGRLFGKFTARECKPPGWHYTGTDREVAQLNFINQVNTLGGDAAFTNSEGSL